MSNHTNAEDGVVDSGRGDTVTERARGLRVWYFLVLILAYLVLVQAMSLALARGQSASSGSPGTVDELVIKIIVPVGLGTFLLLAAVNWIGSWQSTFVDRRPLPRLALIIPVVLFVTAVVITNYSGLSAKGLAFTGSLFVATMMVGFAEELLFRGQRWSRSS